MKGRVESFNQFFSNGFIRGDDGAEYFLHASEVVNAKKIKDTNIVEFDAVDTGESHLRAVNVKKIGHGIHHPFIQDLNRLEQVLKGVPMDEQERDYRLRDIQMMRNYFENVEDFEWCKDPRQFKNWRRGGE